MPRRRYSFAAELPVGKFIGYEIWKRDPSPGWIKSLWILVTVAGLAYMVFSSSIVLALTDIDDSWDENHGYVSGSKSSLLVLIANTLGISRSTLQNLIMVSYGLYAFMIVADMVLDPDKSSLLNDQPTRTRPWPASWKTDNTDCYHTMFAEPTRWGRLLRRPGNILSNVNYLLSSLCVFASIATGASDSYWMADALFSVMLLLLAVFSTIWHASNAPWSQYDDIWSMDSCILFLLIRYCCMGGTMLVISYTGMDSQKARDVAGSVCLLLFAMLVIGLGVMQGKMSRDGYLHEKCPFSGRARLLGKGDVWGQGQIDCHVTTVCAFAILPVIYTGIPTAIQVMLLESVGSVTMATWVVRTLALGWTYRMWDRWVLDGCFMMKMVTAPAPRIPNWTNTFGAAIFSPTAVLHFFTGLTLLFGYVHCLSVEESMR